MPKPISSVGFAHSSKNLWPCEVVVFEAHILRKAAFREVFSCLGEKIQPLFFLELGQLVLYSPSNSSPLDLLSLKSLHLAFLSVIACIKSTASADNSWHAQALH